VDVEENESWQRLKFHPVPLIQYMGKGAEGLQKMREEFDAENEGVVIPTQVRWLANTRTIRKRRQNGEIAASSVVFVIKPKCGYCSGHHRTSDHKCNVVGCTAKQGSLCRHTLEKCPHCKGNYIALSSKCVKKREATEAARQSRKIRLARHVSTSAARNMATGSNSVVLDPRPQGVAEGGGDEEEMADEDEEEEAAGEERDVTMAVTVTESATMTTTDTETEIETGALATNDCSDPAQQRKLIWVDYCCSGDGSRTQGGRTGLARATERKR